MGCSASTASCKAKWNKCTAKCSGKQEPAHKDPSQKYKEEEKPIKNKGSHPKEEANTQSGAPAQEEIDNEFSNKIIKKEKKVKAKTQEKKQEVEEGGFFQVEEMGGGDQFMAIKPWIGALVKPTYPPKNNPNQPFHSLELEYVYGYRSIDSRMNLYYTADPDNVVYMTASLGIVLNKRFNSQLFFGAGSSDDQTGHNDDITALAVSPNRDLVATGQVGKDPIICVWRADNCQLIAQFRQGKDTRAVKAIAFNYDGSMIATVAADNDYSVSVFDLNGKCLGRDKSGPDPVVDVCWSPRENSFTTAGQRGAGYWDITSGTLKGSKGLFGSNKMVALCSVVYGPDGKCYTGSVEGSILTWEGRNCTKTIPVGTGIINAICPTNDKIIVGVGKTIVTLNTTLKKLNEVALNSSVRALDAHGSNILAGLRDGTILELNGGSQTVLMQSHSDGEAWGLEVDSNSGYIITTGDDNKVMSWDPQERKCVSTGIVNETAGPKPKTGGASTLSTFPPNQCARAVCVNSANGHVAVGVNNGELHIYDAVDSLKLIKSTTPAKEWIECMAYSPDGSKLAVGSHDNRIYIFNVDTYKLAATCAKHNSFITSLDWSTDSKYIQSNCGAYEYLFFDAQTGQQITGGATQFRDEPWATFTCKLGWPVQGVFPPEADGSDINGVDRSKSKEIFAVGDDKGLVNLYRNPCLTGAKAKSYKGHSEHVVRVRFDQSDSRLFSIGGYDRTIMQWRVYK